jgi:hypothetical protein
MSGFGHIDLRVSSIEETLPFYEALMPALGFTQRCHGEEWKVWGATDPRCPPQRTSGSLKAWARPEREPDRVLGARAPRGRSDRVGRGGRGRPWRQRPEADAVRA